MMTIEPLYETILDYWAVFVRSSLRGDRIVTASGEGHITVFNEQLVPQSDRYIEAGIKALSVHPYEDAIATISIDGSLLTIADTSGRTIFMEEQMESPLNYYGIMKVGFDNCFFDPHGRWLWCVLLQKNNCIEFQRRDTKSWQVCQQIVVEDPIGGSSFFFCFHPKTEAIVVWVAAGQHGQETFLLYQKNETLCFEKISELSTLQSTLEDVSLVEFHPQGQEFIRIIDYEKLCRYRFPNFQSMGTCHWPETGTKILPPLEKTCFGSYFCYLSDSKAIVNSVEGLLFVIDLDTMEVVDEIAIRGHEPRPYEEVESTPRKWKVSKWKVGLMASDLRYFYPLARDRIISAHEKFRDNPFCPENWKDTIAIWDIKEHFGGFADSTDNQV